MVVASYSTRSSSSSSHGSCIQLGLLFLITAYTCTALDSLVYHDQPEASVPFLDEVMLAHQAHSLTNDKPEEQFQPFAAAASAGHWDDDDHTDEGEPELNVLVKQELMQENLLRSSCRKLLEHDMRSTKTKAAEVSADSAHVQIMQPSSTSDTLESHIIKEGAIDDNLNTAQTSKGVAELVHNRPAAAAAVAQYHDIPRPAPAAAASSSSTSLLSSSPSLSSSSSRGSSSIVAKHKRLRKRHRSSSRRAQMETQKATVTRRSSSSVGESGAFHVDYTAPRTHPPRNN